MLWLDYESKSECDLISRGSYNYSLHPSTKMLCAAYAFDDEDVQLWWGHEPVPARLKDYFASGGQIRAHNASFDRLLTWHVVCPDYDLPVPALDRWYCTAAQARSNCAPGSLEDVGRFASVSMRKDHRGKQLVRLCCLPPFSQDPKVLAELGDYALQDVRAMRAISKAMRELSAEELLDYQINERVNDRGLLIDVDLCRAAVRYAAQELTEIETLVDEVTEGEIASVRSPKMREWVLARVGDEAKALMLTYKDGEEKYSIDKTVRGNLLLLAEENPDQVPPAVADVIQCADDAWASSTAKFNRLANLADDEDQRVRGAFVFAGGSATGRLASYGAQVHNMPRKTVKDPAEVRQAMVRGHAIVPKYGRRVTDVLKGMLRPALVPAPEHVLIVADWAAIEARMNPWLANHPTSEAKLDIFRSGLDVYKAEASKRLSVPITDITPDERQLQKVMELACGYMGGIGAFTAMGRVYGVLLPEAQSKRMVDAWRRANPWAVAYWGALDGAYLRAMRNPKREFTAGRVTYLFDGLHLWYALPSGRILCYPYARLDADGVSYAKASWKPAADAKEWPRARLWPGLAAENICQAAANDVLRVALRRLDQDYKVIATVHDEIVLEAPKDQAETIAQQLKDIMCDPPVWAEGLPLDAEVSVMNRYGKG